MTKFIYIASYDSSGGIVRCRITENGVLEPVDTYPLDRPVYLCAEGTRLYALLREPFQGQSGVAPFGIRPDGSLYPSGKTAPAHGSVSAHIFARNGRIYCANYLGGSTILMPDKLLCHNGSSIHPTRQDCSHPHCLTPAPDGKYLCINDLGTDCIYICTWELEDVSRVQLPPGSGPRHLVFSKDGNYAYCSNELTSSVSVFSYGNGVLSYLNTYSALPDGCRICNTASGIRLSADGRTLFVSNRGHDSICLFDVDGAVLRHPRFIPTGGSSPREITLVDDWLLCANENSDTVTVFSLTDPTDIRLVSTFCVKRPWCILPVRI